MFFSAADVLPLAAKLNQYEKHTSYLACTKRARELYDEATALQTATQTKVAKLQHDAHLETTKIEVNALPAQSPYPTDEDGKAMRSNDQLAFTTRVAILVKETLIRVKAGDMAWVFTGGKFGAFYSKVRLVKFETNAGSDGGKAAYLGPDGVPVELDWTTPGGRASQADSTAFSPQIGDIVDAQSNTGPNSHFRGRWFESKFLGKTLYNGAECFEVALGYPVDQHDRQFIPVTSRRIQPKGTFTTGPFDTNKAIFSLPKTELADSPSFTLPAAAVSKSTFSDRWALLPVASSPTVSENDMKTLLECYFAQLGSAITFLPDKDDDDDAKDDDDVDMCDSGPACLQVGRGYYYGKDKLPVVVVKNLHSNKVLVTTPQGRFVTISAAELSAQ